MPEPDQQDSGSIRAQALRFYPEEGPVSEETIGQILDLWSSGRSFILLSGPPGVGKTRTAEDFVVEILRHIDTTHGVDEARISNLFPDFRTRLYSNPEIASRLAESGVKYVWDIAVMHPQYAYEDLIRGYRMLPSESKEPVLEVREGLFGFASRAVSLLEQTIIDSGLPLGVLILDELNRAPIGQLFGEAIYALDRRGTRVTTPYEIPGLGSDFCVPKSLLILGTMNSVDRAVSGFDFALRRRFSTITMVPRAGAIEESLSDLDATRKIALGLFEAVRSLIQNSRQMGTVPLSELIIGHSYYIPPKDIGEEEAAITWIAGSYRYQILPTLLDYIEQGLLEYDESTLQDLPYSNVLSGEISLGEIDGSSLVEDMKRRYLEHE